MTFGKAQAPLTVGCWSQLKDYGANSTMGGGRGGCFLILTKVPERFSPGRDTRVLKLES